MQPLPSQLATAYSEHAAFIDQVPLIWLVVNVVPFRWLSGRKKALKGKDEKREHVGEKGCESHYFLNMGLFFVLILVSLMAFMPVVLWKQCNIFTPSLQDQTSVFLRTKLVVADNATKYI